MLIQKISPRSPNEVEWTLDSGRIVVHKEDSPIFVVLLRDRSGVLIIESYEKKGSRNLVIVNADGSERFRPAPPFDQNRTYGFSYGGYEMGEMSVVLTTTAGDVSYPFDPDTGIFGSGQWTK